MEISNNAVTNPNGDTVHIVVQMMEGGEKFRVFVDGGLLSDGEDDFQDKDLGTVMARAGKEALTFINNW